MPNWGLRRCCNHDQIVFLVTLAVCSVIILTLWRTVVLLPFKLVTVFLHEASHAVACKLTCGHVEGIQIHADEGGMTQTRGGVYWFILPAGYLGSSFWGMALILASTNLIAARIAAGCLAVALIVVLFIAKNVYLFTALRITVYSIRSYSSKRVVAKVAHKPLYSYLLIPGLVSFKQWTLRGLCIGFIIFLAVVWVLQETTKVKILRYIILFIGAMNSLFSVYDIYGDLISRRVHTSDAEKFAEVCPCCNGVGWGLIWGLISLIFLGAATYLSLVILA